MLLNLRTHSINNKDEVRSPITSNFSQPQSEDDSPIPNAQCSQETQQTFGKEKGNPNLFQLFLQESKNFDSSDKTKSQDDSCPPLPSSLFSDCASSDDSSQSNSKLTLSKTSKISASENSCDNTTVSILLVRKANAKGIVSGFEIAPPSKVVVVINIWR